MAARGLGKTETVVRFPLFGSMKDLYRILCEEVNIKEFHINICDSEKGRVQCRYNSVNKDLAIWLDGKRISPAKTPKLIMFFSKHLFSCLVS